MKVKLRNKDGQFCTLEQFCAEEPKVEISPTRGISYASGELPVMRESLVRLEQLLEIIGAFDLHWRIQGTSVSTVLVSINKYGTAWYCAPSQNTTPAGVIGIVKAWIAEAEALDAKWQAIEYEVNDK